jgi:hypothetical protein
MSVNNASGDVVMTRLNYALGTSQAFNVLHYQIANRSGTVPGVVNTLAAIAERAYDVWSSAWALGASAEVTFTGVSAQNIYPSPRSKLVTYNPAQDTEGVVAGDCLPLQDALTILKDTEYGEKWGLGRIYFVGIPEASQQSGVVNAAATITGANAMAALVNDQLNVVGNGWTMDLNPVLYHAATAATPTGPATATRITPIVNGRVSDFIIKSMKTRRPGKGI